MKLEPYVLVDSTPFSASREQIVAHRGQPLKKVRNSIGLNELDYGAVVYRFQDNGRLEEVSARAPVVYIGNVDVPFAGLEAFVRAEDEAAFERAGFIVSPKFGLAFDPNCPSWVTALAAHCIETWRAI
jgi:transglutaminase-like putative cysteine protease